MPQLRRSHWPQLVDEMKLTIVLEISFGSENRDILPPSPLFNTGDCR